MRVSKAAHGPRGTSGAEGVSEFHTRNLWHALEAARVLALLGSGSAGLTAGEAAARLARHGPNALAPSAARTLLERFVAQLNNVLIFVLLGSAAVTALLGHGIDTAVILGVVVLNAIIGMIQEGKAEAALEAIRGMVSPRASVLRDGKRLSINAAEIVPGDILLLEAGDRVTADVRLVKARNLSIDESALTGESVPVEKSYGAVPDDTVLADRTSMAFSGTLVTGGQGQGVVVACGRATELGRISELIRRVEQLETPLVRQMNAFARQLTVAILLLATVTLVFAVLVRGYDVAEAFMAMVGMAVAAIPEGLPAVMTITLAIGVERMAARNAIVRHLPAVETLGSVSTICSDKTGTLTRNEMTVTRIVVGGESYDVGGVGYEPKGGFSRAGRHVDPPEAPGVQLLCRIAMLCNDASLRSAEHGWTVDGDPMEGALVALAVKAGYDRAALSRRMPRLDEIPFDATRRMMATLHHTHDGTAFVAVKGAPERLIEQSSAEWTPAGDRPLDTARWLAAVDDMARSGQRVLAIAMRAVPSTKRELVYADLDDGLTFIGLAGLIDPPRPEAVAAVAECRSAGIEVKMITGDHAATAGAIARALGLETSSPVLTGRDVDQFDAEALSAAVERSAVFARTAPEHKLRLVEALQAKGKVVAMTGDGVNDAPALKRADVGVAMGKSGTEAAKEAADMVLADDNFASIVAAVGEGRTVYDNLTKVIGWTMPTNGGETLIVVAAILLGLALPMTPVQILWINMVTTVGLGLVLAFEPAEAGVMRRLPRASSAPILGPFLVWRVGLVSVLFALGAFGMYGLAISRGLSEEEARTIVVNTVVVMEIFYLFSVRYRYGTSLTWRGIVGTPAVLLGVGSMIVIQLAFTYWPPLQGLFGTRSVSLEDGLRIVGVGIALFALLEFEKLAVRRFAPFASL